MAGPSLVGCQYLPCVETANCWLVGLCLEVDGFGALGGLGTCDGLLVGGPES